jgi:hypothetical protein
MKDLSEEELNRLVNEAMNDTMDWLDNGAPVLLRDWYGNDAQGVLDFTKGFKYGYSKGKRDCAESIDGAKSTKGTFKKKLNKLRKELGKRKLSV